MTTATLLHPGTHAPPFAGHRRRRARARLRRRRPGRARRLARRRRRLARRRLSWRRLATMAAALPRRLGLRPALGLRPRPGPGPRRPRAAVLRPPASSYVNPPVIYPPAPVYAHPPQSTRPARAGGGRSDLLSAQRPDRRADRGRPPGLQPLGHDAAEGDGRREHLPARHVRLHGRPRLHAALSDLRRASTGQAARARASWPASLRGRAPTGPALARGRDAQRPRLQLLAGPHLHVAGPRARLAWSRSACACS